MSGTFSGFTEDDIKKVQNNLPANKRQELPSVKSKSPSRADAVKNKKTQRVVIRVDQARRKVLESKVAEDANSLATEARLTPPSPSKTTVNEEQPSHANAQQIEQEKESNNNNNQEDTSTPQIMPNKKNLDLEEFQARQKLIEEQNRRRKELLSKALADRTKRTQEEAQRLNEIRQEFKKLDADLSNDVKILRKKIEIASLDYMEAQKQYLKVEKEFLDAKIALQNKLEKKEMLTEHLCTIIEQNEERKARKLNELIEKLDLRENE